MDLVKALIVKEDIKINIEEKDIVSQVINIKTGFPPKPIDINFKADMQVKNNDNFIVEINVGAIPVAPEAVVIKVASDGACLFNAIRLALADKGEPAQEMRSTIATIILTDLVKYNKTYLGGAQEPSAYAQWICKPTQWGGIPELRILSEYYYSEIRVVDIGDHKIHRFAPERDDNATSCIYLMYDGSHYNAGGVTMSKDAEPTTIFECSDENTDKLMLELAQRLKDNGEWVDPNLFAMKCSDCGQPLQG